MFFTKIKPQKDDKNQIHNNYRKVNIRQVERSQREVHQYCFVALNKNDGLKYKLNLIKNPPHYLL